MHAENAAPSTRHSSVDPASDAANVNTGVALLVGLAGSPLTDTVGGVKSKPVVAAATFGSGPMCPAGLAACAVPVSISRLRTACGVGARPPVVAWNTLEYSAAAAATIGDALDVPLNVER